MLYNRFFAPNQYKERHFTTQIFLILQNFAVKKNQIAFCQ